MKLEQAMRDLAVGLGVEHLTPDESGRYLLRIDDKFDVQIMSFDRSSALLLATVGQPPRDDASAQAYLERVLTRSLWHFQPKAKEVVSIDADTRAVQLHRTEDLLSSTTIDFRDAFENFTNSAESWIDFLTQPASQPLPASPMHLLMP